MIKKLLCKLMRYLANILSEVLTWCHTTIAAPTLLTATFDPPDVDLAWVDNATNNTCFLVWRSTDGTNFTLIDTIGDLENYTDTTAVIGISYWYRVQACDGEGNTSDFSNTVTTEELFTDINYGLLYNHFAVKDAHGLAPTGFHIPTMAEWTTLQTYLGGNVIAGGHVKETGIVYWTAPNAFADNSSGFSARGAGRREYDTSVFAYLNERNEIWSQTDHLGTNGISILLQISDSALTIQSSDKNYGYSVRAIKDDSVNPGIVVDIDNNIYPLITIGTQVWMGANLITKHYNDGTPIPEVTDNGAWAGLVTGAWCYYDNDSANQ